MDTEVSDLDEICAQAINSAAVLQELVNGLSGSSRRTRQVSATVLNMVAKSNTELLSGHTAAFVDALDRPEAQTRWECLDVLTALIPLDVKNCEKGINGAEASLFDDESGLVRLSAMRFMCRLAATSEKLSERLWPYIDEAIQCYHGDYEFQDMLNAVTDLSKGSLASEVRQGLITRMSFDANNAKGSLKRRAQTIIENLN